MTREYRCESCNKPITFRTYRLAPYCFPCQGAYNLVNYGERGSALNIYLKKRFNVSDQQIQEAIRLPYWQDRLTNITS